MVNRGKTCWDHNKIKNSCKGCREAQDFDGHQRFFGVKERAAIAAAKPR
jgi:hypothetical protein